MATPFLWIRASSEVEAVASRSGSTCRRFDRTDPKSTSRPNLVSAKGPAGSVTSSDSHHRACLAWAATTAAVIGP